MRTSLKNTSFNKWLGLIHDIRKNQTLRYSLNFYLLHTAVDDAVHSYSLSLSIYQSSLPSSPYILSFLSFFMSFFSPFFLSFLLYLSIILYFFLSLSLLLFLRSLLPSFLFLCSPLFPWLLSSFFSLSFFLSILSSVFHFSLPFSVKPILSF